ncbi:S8 family peptidase [Fodinibius saliphilus]|uniref:S8 family peptidase n=1 Tax=Fodinibius saliphilus TaxID=1920650 RepID=UPI001107A874|nr:S8 family serine peptidase [Fodinibius saliphilus]
MSGTKIRDVTRVVKTDEEIPIRTKLPERGGDSNKKGVLYAGFEVQVAEEWNGEEIEGNNLWYRDKNGDFYWSGWFEEIKQDSEISIEGDQSIELSWWLSGFGIKEVWDEGYMGEGVSIAVLDTGIDIDHPNLKHSFNQIDSFNFLSRDKDVQDWNGHGTHCSGIIAANGVNNVWGVAPKAKVISGKITRSVISGINLDVLADAIEYYNGKVDLISISAGVSRINKRVREAIEACEQTLIVAAIGNSETRRKGDYPAEHESVLAVGAVDELEKITDYTIRSKNLGICAPGHEIYSTAQKGGYKTDSGTSMATPYVSGLLALAKSKSPQKSMSELSNLLIETCVTKQSGNYSYDIINSTKFMERV